MYSFYLSDTLLPVTPEKLTLKIKNANKTMTLINEGEINFLKSPGLTEVEFDCVLPHTRYSFARYDGGFKPFTYFLDKFEKLKTEKKPFQFVVVRGGSSTLDTNMTVSMEQYNIKEQAKDGDDLTVTVKLKQYRPFGTKIVKVVDDSANVENNREQDNSPAPDQDTTYTVKAGDCLWNIAKKLYGDGMGWKKLAEANKDTVINPNLIFPGQVLNIPAAEKKEEAKA